MSSGCSAVRLAHHVRDVGVAGSNPVIPTLFLCFDKDFRDVAQSGSALRSGRRGRRFKSCHPDFSLEAVHCFGNNEKISNFAVAKRLGGGIGRRAGLKIQFPLRECGFDSHPRYRLKKPFRFIVFRSGFFVSCALINFVKPAKRLI